GVFTPYAGIVFDVTRAVTAYVSYADIFQPTTVIDENAQVIDPATGINLETGLKIALFDDQMNISGAVFETKQDNVPQWVGILDDGRYYYRAVDGTKTRGYEIEVAGRIGPSWNLSGGFARSLPKDGQGQRWLVHIPTNTFKLYSSYRFDSGVLQGLTVGGNFRWQSEIENNNPQPRGLGLRYVQDAYGVLDLMAKYSVTPRVSAQLNVNNLFDKKYFTDVQLNGWYGEPRNAVLSVRFAY
ncbi:TonB-dependent siderophore receptor, partial [Steroidobacter sp.]|uniref:TonB-dependent siderophore receptor n=1 Tax=Steroidobacter sp. TaxID=1978227 RepID=UPI001A3F0D94